MRTHLMHMHKAVFQELDPEDAMEESAQNALTTTLRKVKSTPLPDDVKKMADQKVRTLSFVAYLSFVRCPPSFRRVTYALRFGLPLQIALWIARRARPISIGDSDIELQEAFDIASSGAYKMPGYQAVYQLILGLSKQGKGDLKTLISVVRRARILPSIAGDIWGQGGISVFGLLAYFIDEEWNYHEKLIRAIPFGAERHTGGNILVATKLACAEVGIGTYREETGDGEEEEDNNVDTVSDNVMNTVSDSASNMVSGWDEFNGYECCCHMLALSVLLFTRDGDVGKTFKNLRGMSNHFSHSILGCNLLHECQLAQGTPQTKPPRDNDTRTGWKGARNVAQWYHTQQTAVQWYDVQQPLQAATACKNPDGSVYKDHKNDADQWIVTRDAYYVLDLPYQVVLLLEATKHPTISLILPTIGKLIGQLSTAVPFKVNKKVVTLCPAVVKSMAVLHADLTRRFFTNLMESKLEDWVVACGLDPRYKNFTFKNLTCWNKGKLTQKQCVMWLQLAWETNWKPKAAEAVTTSKPVETCALASFLCDSDDEEEEVPTEAMAPSGDKLDELGQYLQLPVEPASIDKEEEEEEE
ncbi:hypothetical protein CYMTET_11379 [Cymbomonas tetramitiformis]|uniref:Uncharacterized protein n=1 Tax=Cymbomonas tetramitiformis TaxID=36881 RepID=A0AAE0GMN6_9CHLO|nr:hypothetical protein CYMTET_11379 [Cymbomonas tetramitiformis]